MQNILMVACLACQCKLTMHKLNTMDYKPTFKVSVVVNGLHYHAGS